MPRAFCVPASRVLPRTRAVLSSRVCMMAPHVLAQFARVAFPAIAIATFLSLCMRYSTGKPPFRRPVAGHNVFNTVRASLCRGAHTEATLTRNERSHGKRRKMNETHAAPHARTIAASRLEATLVTKPTETVATTLAETIATLAAPASKRIAVALAEVTAAAERVTERRTATSVRIATAKRITERITATITAAAKGIAWAARSETATATTTKATDTVAGAATEARARLDKLARLGLFEVGGGRKHAGDTARALFVDESLRLGLAHVDNALADGFNALEGAVEVGLHNLGKCRGFNMLELDGALHHLEVLGVDGRVQDDRLPRTPRAARAPAAVDVGLDHARIRGLRLQHELDLGDVNAARSHVRGDNHVDVAVAELLHEHVALVLRQLAVKGRALDAVARQIERKLRRLDLRWREHHRLLRVLLRKDGAHNPHVLCVD
eukprot:Opistho-1_new@90038